MTYTLTFVGGPVDGSHRDADNLFPLYHFRRQAPFNFDYWSADSNAANMEPKGVYEYELTHANGRPVVDDRGRYVYRYRGEL